MKFFQIILIFLLGGCTFHPEGVDYLGTAPYYAITKPHPVGCECCNPLAPSELQNKFFKVKKSKKKSWLWHHLCHTGGMSIGKNARCSQIIKEVSNGKFVKNNKFHSMGSVIEDSIMAQQEEADRRLAQIKLRRAKAWI